MAVVSVSSRRGRCTVVAFLLAVQLAQCEQSSCQSSLLHCTVHCDLPSVDFRLLRICCEDLARRWGSVFLAHLANDARGDP